MSTDDERPAAPANVPYLAELCARAHSLQARRVVLIPGEHPRGQWAADGAYAALGSRPCERGDVQALAALADGEPHQFGDHTATVHEHVRYGTPCVYLLLAPAAT